MKKINNITIETAAKLHVLGNRFKRKLRENTGEFAMNNGVSFVVIVALAAVVLGLLIAYFKGDFSDAVKSKISDLFSMT